MFPIKKLPNKTFGPDALPKILVKDFMTNK